ncbi:hypothetical protein KY285_031334 [Solanum tuberosum]|nr:hypothetical protein KY284_031127 [Solanum tuberosum]KAH0656452.1 hypothetical protein KY285_031334 [Solanum tuberosum]
MIGKGKTIGSIAAKWPRSRSSKAGLQSQSVVSPDSSKPERDNKKTGIIPRHIQLLQGTQAQQDRSFGTGTFDVLLGFEEPGDITNWEFETGFAVAG